MPLTVCQSPHAEGAVWLYLIFRLQLSLGCDCFMASMLVSLYPHVHLLILCADCLQSAGFRSFLAPLCARSGWEPGTSCEDPFARRVLPGSPAQERPLQVAAERKAPPTLHLAEDRARSGRQQQLPEPSSDATGHRWSPALELRWAVFRQLLHFCILRISGLESTLKLCSPTPHDDF